MYKKIIKPILFRFDPENIHDRFVAIGKFLGKVPPARKLLSAVFSYQNPILKQEILGIKFRNPIGLSAGFDKNAELTDILPSIGFGFAEVGSITGQVCFGNPKPRLWRLKDSQSLVVYYGLKNDGCDAISRRLENRKFKIPIGMSVAMTNCTENLEIESAIKDYVKAFKAMEGIGSYVTVNISCPNTKGGQPFNDPENLKKLLEALDKIHTEKPVFIKMSPDLEESILDAILEIASAHRIHGIICTNLTKKRDSDKIKDKDIPEKGGISGKVVEGSADDLLSYVYKKSGSRFVLIGSGGVFSAEDAYKKIRLGASLVQILTGMIFEGPKVVGDINKGLVKLLKKDGFNNIKDAIGADHRN